MIIVPDVVFSQVKEVAEYFGEDPVSCNSSVIFEKLTTFVQTYEASLGRVQQQRRRQEATRKQEQRRAGHPPTGGTKRPLARPGSKPAGGSSTSTGSTGSKSISAKGILSAVLEERKNSRGERVNSTGERVNSRGEKVSSTASASESKASSSPRQRESKQASKSRTPIKPAPRATVARTSVSFGRTISGASSLSREPTVEEMFYGEEAARGGGGGGGKARKVPPGMKRRPSLEGPSSMPTVSVEEALKAHTERMRAAISRGSTATDLSDASDPSEWEVESESSVV